MLDVITKRTVDGKAFPLGLHWMMLLIAGGYSDGIVA